MEPIELIMKVWGIAEEDRAELENILKNTREKHLGLALMSLGAATDEAAAAENDRWMQIYLPEVQLV